jgi:energy-coupling factor transporter ATP-binding protein EcfA2
MVTTGLVRDRRDVLQLSKRERLVLNESMRVETPFTAKILNEIRRNHDMQSISAEPPCIVILGPTGAGKSTLISIFAKQYPCEYTDTAIHRPVLKVLVPAKATLMNFLTAILEAFEDPIADKGTIGNKTHRIYEFVEACGVIHIMVDEPNHFIDRDSQKIIQDSSNFLKNLIKDKRLACTLAGLKDTEQVLRSNSQLGRLFGDPYVLADYEWDEKQPQTIKTFRTFLYELDELLPLPEISNLASLDRAWRCFVACGGRLGYLMALIRRATEYAINRDQECLDDELLADAFDNRLAGERRGVPNPFIGDLPKVSPKIVDEESSPATNKRSKRRKKDDDDLGYVFRK